MKVGFIGIGHMGEPMARNLLRAGIPLTLWNRSPEKCEALIDIGAEQAARLAAMVAQDKQLRVFLGADAQVPYQKLVVAMDALKRAKVEKVSLVTESGSNAR